jgi:flagellar biogenesis protein FliO
MLQLPLSVFTVATLAAETAPRAMGNGPDLTRYLLVCVGLIAFVVFGGWAFRRLFKRVLVGKAARRSLQIVDLLPMGGKQRVAVVRCYDRTFLLGLGEKELCVISELDPVIAPENVPAPTRADATAFASVLSKLRGLPAAPVKEPVVNPRVAKAPLSNKPIAKETVAQEPVAKERAALKPEGLLA